jgi:hypothetical protein
MFFRSVLQSLGTEPVLSQTPGSGKQKIYDKCHPNPMRVITTDSRSLQVYLTGEALRGCQRAILYDEHAQRSISAGAWRGW